jgi:transcriptional regulator with XRE-family HTH domain
MTSQNLQYGMLEAFHSPHPALRKSVSLLHRSKLPAAELALIRRLSAERIAARFSQAQLADEAGVSRPTVKNYEYGLAPLSFPNGVRICRRLNLNQRWVATGDMPKRPFVPLAELDDDPSAWDKLSTWTFRRVWTELHDTTMQRWIKAHPTDELVEATLREGPKAVVSRLTDDALREFLREWVAMLGDAQSSMIRLAILGNLELAIAEMRRRIAR